MEIRVFQKLNLKIGILKIGVSKIKFERNWSFENYFRIGVLKMKALKIKLEKWSFED